MWEKLTEPANTVFVGFSPELAMKCSLEAASIAILGCSKVVAIS